MIMSNVDSEFELVCDDNVECEFERKRGGGVLGWGGVRGGG